jgi:hypothetical protein
MAAHYTIGTSKPAPSPPGGILVDVTIWIEDGFAFEAVLHAEVAADKDVPKAIEEIVHLIGRQLSGATKVP